MYPFLPVLTPELRRVWEACRASAGNGPGVSHSVCYTWAVAAHRKLFGHPFRQPMMAELERLGYLTPEVDSRGGRRHDFTVNCTPRIPGRLRA